MADNENDADRRALDALRKSESEESHREAQRARDAGASVGSGMTSADSTEAPLHADTGEPDDRALGYNDEQDGQ
jgi:hypothetical protein